MQYQYLLLTNLVQAIQTITCNGCCCLQYNRYQLDNPIDISCPQFSSLMLGIKVFGMKFTQKTKFIFQPLSILMDFIHISFEMAVVVSS